MSGVKKVSFKELVKKEPRLKALLDEAAAWKRHKPQTFCANTIWYGYAGHAGLKPRLVAIIGYERPGDDELLKSHIAYDVAYETICKQLPDCDEGCYCSTFRCSRPPYLRPFKIVDQPCNKHYANARPDSYENLMQHCRQIVDARGDFVADIVTERSIRGDSFVSALEKLINAEPSP